MPKKQDKRKRTEKRIKVRDLKPSKDAKGGLIGLLGPSPKGQTGHGTTLPAVQGPTGNQ